MTVLLFSGGQKSAADAHAELDREISVGWASLTADQVRAKIRAIDGHPFRDLFSAILAGALAKHAPHHLGLLPPEWISTVEPQGNA